MQVTISHSYEVVYELSIGTKIGKSVTLNDLERHNGGYLWSPYVIGQTIKLIFLPCDFYLLSSSYSFFLFLA